MVIWMLGVNDSYGGWGPVIGIPAIFILALAMRWRSKRPPKPPKIRKLPKL